jgi:hypothetical protein
MSLTKASYSMITGAVVNVLDYGADPTGATDSAAAIQAAINSLGTYERGTVFIPKGAYKVASSISVGGTASAYPLVIKGVGQGTQIINAASAAKPTFLCKGNHWFLKDMLLTGNSTNPNNGIEIDGTTIQTIRWNIENIVCQMAGVGIQMQNTNTGVIRDYKSWPDSNDNSLTIAQTVSAADISHGIYALGTYAHDVSIYDADCVVRANWGAGVSGIKWSTSGNSYNVRIFGGLLQGGADNAHFGLNISRVIGLVVEGVYHETSILQFSNCAHGSISGTNVAGVGGQIQLLNNTQYMTFIGCNCGVLNIIDSSCTYNKFEGCYFPTTINVDASETSLPTNSFENLKNYTISKYGGIRYKTVTYVASMTPNCRDGDIFVITATNSTAFTINAATNGVNGMVIKITVRNTSGGALGTITWDPLYKMSAWTNPATGFSRTVEFYYDTTYGSGANWIQSSQTVDIPN